MSEEEGEGSRKLKTGDAFLLPTSSQRKETPMKSIALLLLAAVAAARQQVVLSSVITDAAHSTLDWFNDATHKVQDAVSGVRSFESVHTDGIDCESTLRSNLGIRN